MARFDEGFAEVIRDLAAFTGWSYEYAEGMIEDAITGSLPEALAARVAEEKSLAAQLPDGVRWH